MSCVVPLSRGGSERGELGGMEWTRVDGWLWWNEGQVSGGNSGGGGDG